MWLFLVDNVIDTKEILMKGIGTVIKSMQNKEHRKLLMVTDATNRTLINVAMLNHFLRVQGSSGIFITFDRPHQYIKKLLDINNINYDNLTFIDAISIISGNPSGQDNSMVRFINGPYKICLFDDFVARSYSKDGADQDVNLDELGFIMIDDISALCLYNKDSDVKKFIINFFTKVDGLDAFIVAFTLDANYNKELYRFVRRYCEKEIFINPDKQLVRETSLNPTKEGSGSTKHPLLKKKEYGSIIPRKQGVTS